MSDENTGKLGTFLLLFIAIIIGLILLQSSAQQVGEITRTTSYINATVTAAANGAAVDLAENIKVATITDVRNGTVQFTSGNYTALNNRIVNGAFARSQLRTDDAFMAGLINVTYTGEPFTYSNNSGARSVAGLIILLFAVALLIISIFPVIKERFFD